MKISTSRCWIAEDGKTLVPDGNPQAAILFARAEQRMTEKELAPFANAGDFFEDINPAPGKDQGEQPEAEESDEPEPEAEAGPQPLTAAQIIKPRSRRNTK